MNGRFAGALAVALVLVAGACSSTDDDSDAASTTEGTVEGDTTTTAAEVPTPPEGSTVGITDSTINVAVLYSDTQALEEAGVLPEIGDPVQDFEVFAELTNEAGGVAGRQVDLSTHSFAPGAAAGDQRPACIAAAEDEEAAVVFFLGGMSPETVLCTSEEYERFGYAISGVLADEIYERADGRFFNHAMSADRLMAAWVDTLDANGTLEGATIGIVRGDLADHEAAGAALEAALADAGYEVAEPVVLPCEGVSCTQHEAGIERLRTADVDTVFVLLGATAYPALVLAADAVGYEPQWLSSDFENQVFDSATQFMAPAAQNYDGAIGFTYGLDQPPTDAFGEECNAQFTEVTGVEYAYGDDAWFLVRNVCYMFDRLAAAAEIAQSEGGALNQTTLIEAFETFDWALGDNAGTWGPGKHDAADRVVLKSFDPECVCWAEIEGTRTEVSG